MRIFSDYWLRDSLEARREQLRREVFSEEANQLLNMNETAYIKYLVERHTIAPLLLDMEGLSQSQQEERIPAEKFPNTGFHVQSGESYRKWVWTFAVPFSGDPELWRYTPSRHFRRSIEVEVRSERIEFSVVNWRDNADEIRREKDKTLNFVRSMVANVAQEVEEYNANLERSARAAFLARKTELLKVADMQAAIGVPVRKAEGAVPTFSVPVVKKKQIIVKPTAPSAAFAPEPTLDLTVYEAVLRMLRDFGREMERHPSIYLGKDEETLRDHFLMVLSPNFQSVTGEAFNKSGKTDILIRHEGQNVFVAECKFWSGMKNFFKTIDQTFSYLTWRDSKAAILCFVKNKEFGSVLKQIEGQTAEHECSIRFSGSQEEGWFNFYFHIKDDESRGVKLAVLCFHFPAM